MCQKIYGSLNKFLDVQVQRQKSNPSTTMLHRWEVLFFVCSIRFSPKMIVSILTKSLYFGLICPANFQKFSISSI